MITKKRRLSTLIFACLCFKKSFLIKIFKVFTKMPKSRGDKGNLENFEMQVKLIFNCPKALAITCLSHKGLSSGTFVAFKLPIFSLSSFPIVGNISPVARASFCVFVRTCVS